MIISRNEDRPTNEMIEKAWDRNKDGGGVAYRGKNGKVVWKKGLNFPEMKQFCQEMPTPSVAHFRVASCGGVRPALTHPFPIDVSTSTALEGETDGYVLFHNGDWKRWDEIALQAAVAKGIPIPVGKWSDSRAIAWLMSIYGHGFMELLPTQKGVAFGPKDMDIFTGGGWKKINNVWCSNDYFLSTAVGYSGGWQGGGTMCYYPRCTRTDNLDLDHRCPEHKLPPRAFPNTNNNTTGVGAKEVPQTNALPFLRPTEAPGTYVSIELAEKLHSEGKLSKQCLKSIRKAYGKLHLEGKPGQKARRALELATVQARRAALPPILLPGNSLGRLQ